MRRLANLLVSLAVLFGLVFGTVTLVRLANGDFAGDYTLSGTFPRAGEGLHPGSAVVFRGVQVGRVLHDLAVPEPGRDHGPHRALLQGPGDGNGHDRAGQLVRCRADLHRHPGRQLPTPGRTWRPVRAFAHAGSSNELGDLFAAATPLLNKVDTTNLSTVLGELSQASQGEGPKIAASISAGTQLAGLLDRTLNAQLLALDSFARFTQAVAPAAADLNNLNAQINAGLPSFNAEEADYQNLLNTLIPFSDRLAALLSTYHPDIATILTSGDNVSRVLLAQQDTIGQVIDGAYHYFQKIAQGASGLTKLPDGSTYAYFNTFILFNDVNSLVCNLIAPPTGGMSFLQPIQQALAGAGSAFNCSAELASFNALQNAADPAPAATAAPRPPSRRPPPPAPTARAPRRPTRSTASSASPTSPSPTTLGGILNQLSGGAL